MSLTSPSVTKISLYAEIVSVSASTVHPTPPQRIPYCSLDLVIALGELDDHYVDAAGLATTGQPQMASVPALRLQAARPRRLHLPRTRQSHQRAVQVLIFGLRQISSYYFTIHPQPL